jgi:hypothetical protein
VQYKGKENKKEEERKWSFKEYYVIFLLLLDTQGTKMSTSYN